MADLAQIIANIDGYRNYETNKALELQNQAQLLQNQAQNIQNQEIMTINDLKNQIAGLSNNPYAKLNAWSPETRGKQLLNEDKQLKIASKWASSIKNLAPEKRAQGYAQFLRAMNNLGLDVSDMPQAYDEGYVNQIADLGIETETRYQNEQQNARQERQIEAQREARQDEFNKRLAAFDYENSYRTQAEKEKQAQIDAMIDNSTLSPSDKERAKLAYRNITLPQEKTPEARLMETFTNPATSDEDRLKAREQLKQIAELKKEVSSIAPVTNKDLSSIISNIATAQKNGLQNASEIAKSLTGYDADFGSGGNGGIGIKEATDLIGKANLTVTPESFSEAIQTGDATKLKALPRNSGQSSQVQAFNALVENGIPVADALVKSGLDVVGSAGAKAEAEMPFKIDFEKMQQRGRENLAVLNSELDKEKAQNQSVLKMNEEQYKATLPTNEMRNLEYRSQVTGMPVSKIISQDFNIKQLEAKAKEAEINLKKAQIAQAMANTQKAQAELPLVGTTPQIQNARFIQQNPEMANSPAFKGNQAKDKGETDLRKEFNQITKDYRVVGDSYMRILKASEKPSAAGDLSLIFNYMKMLDPNSVVRESEFSNAENARAWFDETGAPTFVKLAYQKAQSGQRLLKEQREDFVNMATNLMAAQKESFDSYAREYGEIARQSGYDPTRVIIDPYSTVNKQNSGNSDPLGIL